MKSKLHFKLGLLCVVLSFMLAAPALGQVKDDSMERFKQRRMEIIKQLKLDPEKEKAALAVDDKYSGPRKEIVAALKKNQEELQKVLAAPKPDEAKVKELVSAINNGMDSLFNSFRSQRDEEMAQMSPIDQGKYLIELSQWREEMFKAKPAPKKKKRSK
ncbi:MAG: periplasmic heavy metal sensor [Deltaproteobacteria bacterium]|nr:MAG: periplasmic heavy metal sensor [Deltaproteobacteria bacterium]